MKSEEVVDILLVEDNPNDAELAVRALRKKNLANPVLVVEDGQQAIDYLFRQGAFANESAARLPKVILLDLKLPKIGGLEVLKLVKSSEKTKSIPVVVLTSSKEDPDIQAAYSLGANSYVVKPVEFSSFVDALTQLGFYWLMLNESPI